MPHLCTEAFVQSVVLCSNSVCCAFVPLFPGVVKIQGESTQQKRNWTLPNKMQCLTPPKEGAVTSQPLEFLSKGSWSRPLRPPHSPRRDSGTMMSSVGSAAWPTARESPTVGCSLMATQQVGVLRILSTVGWSRTQSPALFRESAFWLIPKGPVVLQTLDPRGSPQAGSQTFGLS